MGKVGVCWSATIKFTAFRKKGEPNGDSQQTRYYHRTQFCNVNFDAI
jgi:hypothetical protein